MKARLLSVGEALIAVLEANGVDVVFGIPGVHTVELYRGLAASRIRHITPRHEQAAGFMADGYARVSRRPGVCLLITGPGLTNALTPVAQARADSVPLLLITGVNRRRSLGHGRGHLHEVPDQVALTRSLTVFSHTLLDADDLPDVMARAFGILGSVRPGPVHIEIPTDVMATRIEYTPRPTVVPTRPAPDPAAISAATQLCLTSKRPAIVLGGGARKAALALPALAERLDAPVITTVNARGLLGGHELEVPASPSLAEVRQLIGDSDLVIALGTEMGPTDFDMYEDGGFPAMAELIRVDIDAAQLVRGPRASVAIAASTEHAVNAMLSALPTEAAQKNGADRAATTRRGVLESLPPSQRQQVEFLRTITNTFSDCIIVGDSTQPVYAGNFYCEIGPDGRWFNSATGYGALGYGPPAAIGAALAAPEKPVVCIVGDGGMQFALSELGSAADARTPVIFCIWNNDGYHEIENYMNEKGIVPIGVNPTPPDFIQVARAYGLAAEKLSSFDLLQSVLRRLHASKRPALIELREQLPVGIE